MKLALVAMIKDPIPRPGSHLRHETFKDDAYELVWNQEAHAISIKCRKSGAVRIVDQSSCYWDPLVTKVEAKPEQKR